MYGPSFWFVPLLPHVQSIFLSLNNLNLFSHMYSPSQHAVPSLWKIIRLIQGGGMFSYMNGPSFWFIPLLPHDPVGSIQSILICSTQSMKKNDETDTRAATHPFILCPRFFQLVEIWFKKSGSRIVVDQKKMWFYAIDLAFFRLE